MRIAPHCVLPHGPFTHVTFSTFKPDVICSVVPKFSDIRLGTHIVMWSLQQSRVAEEVSIKYVCIYPIKIGTLEQNRLEPLRLLGLSLFQSCSDQYQNPRSCSKVRSTRLCPASDVSWRLFLFLQQSFRRCSPDCRFRPSVPKFGTRIGTDFYARWNTSLRKSRPVFMTLVSPRSA